MSLSSEYRAGSGEVLTGSGHSPTGKPGGTGFAEADVTSREVMCEASHHLSQEGLKESQEAGDLSRIFKNRISITPTPSMESFCSGLDM